MYVVTMTEEHPIIVPAKMTDTAARFLIPRAGGRVIARLTTIAMLVTVSTPAYIYLPVCGLIVLVVSVSAGWSKSPSLPVVGRIAGQLREHLEKITVDWLNVAAIMVIALLWKLLSPRPEWFAVFPVAITAFACWTAHFASLPAGAMGRWFHFRLRSTKEMIANPFRNHHTPADITIDGKTAAPAPISPAERTSWHSEQQERFDGWLAEEIHRFENQDSGSADHNGEDGKV